MDVIIVNYRTAALTIACVESLEAERASVPNLRVIVVDNDSGDGSADHIATAIDARSWHWATLLRSPVNGGFAAGNNLAIRHALARADAPELLWLLNPDTRVRPGAAAELVTFMRAHPNAGIAGSALLEADGQPWPFAFRFPSILGELERGMRLGAVSRALAGHAMLRRMGDEPALVDWVSGASCVVRATMVDTLRAMDDRYFLYFEETDFCLQARRAGWECWYVPAAVVLHIAGQSTGVTGAQAGRSRMPKYWFESRRRYFEKNHGKLYAIGADLAWASAHLLWRVRRWLQRAPNPDPPALLTDFLRNSSMLPQWRARRGAADSR